MGAIIHDLVSYNERVQHDFSSLLNAGLSVVQRQLIDRVAQESDRRGLPLYAVGGLPRDLWLGSPVTDLDLVAEGDAVALARALVSRFGGTVTVHPKFRTAKWDLRGTAFEARAEAATLGAGKRPGHFLDLVSARRETYRHPGALPTVKLGPIADDIRRRDFTINTLAVRLDGPHFGEVRDDFGAVEDLTRGSVRVLHAQSFLDDPTRMYRAVRYEQRFAFKIADDTLALMPGARPLLGRLSGQRIRHELDLILDEPAGGAMMARLANLHLIRPIHSDLPQGKAALARLKLAGQAPAVSIPTWSRRHVAWLLWLMDLDEAQIRRLSKRLHMPGVALRELLAGARLYAVAGSFTRRKPSQCTAVLDKYPELAVYAVSLSAPARLKRVLDQYLTRWKHMRPTTTGHDLKNMGLPPGPAYRRILGSLRDAWIDGRVTNSDGERLLLRELVHRSSSASATRRTRRPLHKSATARASHKH